jgi:phosphoribosyl-ATP pyrophosphohydrolase
MKMEPSAASSDATLERLAAVIESRKPQNGGDAESSYVARLFAKGHDAILKKIGEEATEVVMAAKDGHRERLVAEMADLWFHSLIALAAFSLKPADVLSELQRREGLSGLDEFALRKVREREELAAARTAPDSRKDDPTP